MNIPNFLTIARIILVPFFIYHLYQKTDLHFALSLYAICALTDLLDGLIARQFKMKSSVGTLLDPLADKVLVLSSFYVLTLFNKIPIWFFVIVLGKEVITVSGWILIYILTSSYKISVPLVGKAAVFLEMLLIPALLLNLSFVNIFFYATSLLLAATTLDYCIKGAKQIAKHYKPA